MAKRANILIAHVQVPFTRGGAEVLVDRLKEELIKRDFNADIVELPFSAIPNQAIANQMVLWRSLDLKSFAGLSVDGVICTKFPAYLIAHPKKVVWLVHQHRQLYELYGTRFGDFATHAQDEAIRQMVYKADTKGLSDAVARFTISENVSARMKRYNALDSQALLPPIPLAGRYRSDTPKPYILYVGRLCSIKRVDLLIQSLPQITSELRVKLVGLPDEPGIESYLKSEIEKHHLSNRVEFLGRVSDDELLSLYAECFCVYYAPFDEDYGFVTLEALSSGKPVITMKDSGGVLSFIEDGHNGIICEPSIAALASSINSLFGEPHRYRFLVSNAKESARLPSWDEVVESLTNPILGTDQGLKEAISSPKH